MSICAFADNAQLRKEVHGNETLNSRRRVTALEKNPVNKYSRKHAGIGATSFLYLTLLSTITYLFY